jgi:flagellar biosynthesis protein FlhA
MAAATATNQIQPTSWLDSKLATHSNTIFVIGLVIVLITLLIPLPTVLLDALLACSISLAITVLIITLSTKEALDLSTFPSLLLFVTLFRLSLNVASTRLILLQGNAGHIIATFGNFVAGGNLIVGLVIFLILAIIQFIVITKGAERISEVSARFILDAMPGKQMAIDADLNAGTITDAEARQRRSKIVKESEFYGAMDGASKFIRGDAIAGLIIVCVNLVGGIVLGYTRGMTLGSAVKTYSILSVGDGLVSQIPSVIIAVSSGFLVTKISSQRSLSHDVTNQFLQNRQPITIAAVVMGLMALVPGFPKIPFILLAVTAAAIARYIGRAEPEQQKKTGHAASSQALTDKTPLEELLDVDRIAVLIGVRLITMVDPRKKSSLFERIGALRRKFAQEYGVLMPLVRLRDSITLAPDTYEIRLYDHVVAAGKLEPDKFLAMDPGVVQKPIEGQKAIEPVYGLPALWVTPANKEAAELAGYTVIDPESVLITHLSETLQRHAHELLTRDDVQKLVDRLRQTQPSLVGEVVGELVPMGLLQRVMQNLLEDGIPVRDLTHILESLGENAPRTKNARLLTEIARKSLARTITEKYKDALGHIDAITFEPSLEHHMLTSLRHDHDEAVIAVEPEIIMEMTRNIAQAYKSAMDKGRDKIVLMCDARLRTGLKSVLARAVPRLPVVAYDEIIVGTQINAADMITVQAAASAFENELVSAGA